jgi:hypothetical protein
MCPGDRGESQCFDTDNDVDHCGNCWTRCPVDGKCEDGICVSRDSDSVPDFESTPFGVGDVTNSELTAEQFGTFLPKKFPGHELITNLDRGSWEAVMYQGLNDSTMYLYMDPGDPNAQYAVAVGNVSVLPLTTDMRGFLTDLEFACNPSSGCEVLQQNIIRPGRVTYVFLSHRFNDQPDPYYSLIWGETRGSLVYTLEAFTQTNFENLANGFVNNALAAMEQ